MMSEVVENTGESSFGEAQLAKEHSYTTSSVAEALAVFRKARAETVQLFSGLSEDQSRRTGVFEGYGPLSLRSLAHYLCSHDQQRLAGLQWLLG
jgi:DinB superfamily